MTVYTPPSATIGTVTAQVSPEKMRAPDSAIAAAPGAAPKLGVPHSNDVPAGDESAIVNPAGKLTASTTPFSVVARFGFWMRRRSVVASPGRMLSGKNDASTDGASIPLCPRSSMTNGPAFVLELEVVVKTPVADGVKLNV